MSGELKITFGADMPPSALEVVSPDLEVVGRLMMRGGDTRSIAVPSEASFLRVHLPSGESVTLSDPGSLNRDVTLADVLKNRGFASRATRLLSTESLGTTEAVTRVSLPDRQSIKDYLDFGRKVPPVDDPLNQDGLERTLGTGDKAVLKTEESGVAVGVTSSSSQEVLWQDVTSPTQPPLTLSITHPDDSVLKIRIPADIKYVRVRVDVLGQGSRIVSVRVATRNAVADAIVNYLARGDYDSAESMQSWVDESIDMLMEKMSDPYAAAVGGYLLLTLNRISELDSWARRLAEQFEWLPDASVIFAWQRAAMSHGTSDDAARYLLLAAKQGLPVYTAGLRRLFDGLRLMGSQGEQSFRGLTDGLGEVLWSSPFSAWVRRAESTAIGAAVSYDIQAGT